MGLRWALLLAPLLAVMLRSSAGAQTSSNDSRVPLALQSEACAGLARTELHELIALELAPRRVVGADAVAGAVRATLVCDEREARVSLQTVDQRQHQVQLDFAEIQPTARPRLVALALSELLATAAMEQQAPAPEKPAPEPAPKPRATPGAPPEGSLWLAVGLARDGRPRLLAPLGELGFRWHLGALPLAFDAKLFGGAGERALRVGRMQTWSLGGAFALTYAPRLGPATLGVGAGVKLGCAQLRGRADESSVGRSVSGMYWGPALLVNGVLALRGRWGLRAGIDLAYLVRGVEGSDLAGRRLFTYGGLQLHATLGVNMRF